MGRQDKLAVHGAVFQKPAAGCTSKVVIHIEDCVAHQIGLKWPD